MNGLDLLGVDWLQVAKGGADMLSKTGASLSSSGDKKDNSVKEAERIAERQRVEAEKEKAQESAYQMKLVAGAAATALGSLIIALLLRKKSAK